ncbi:MAG: hypothetical protein RML36_04360 [Anaerolineae bacterium]|nr:hypothetical protein [Anaerolineae bacterium]MDW8098705.1 hypothetical protein [Anaerolineae bacterium]
MPTQDVDAILQRLGPPDELQIRLLLRVPPERRLLTMLEMQSSILDGLLMRLRRQHPELSDYEHCRLMFQRLYQNG